MAGRYVVESPETGGRYVEDTGEQPLSRPMRLGMAGMQGLVRGGPMGAMLGLNTEAGTQWDEATKQVAYKAGQAATDFATEKGASPETAAAVGFGSNVATQAVPVALGALGGKYIGDAVGKSMGTSTMRGVIKPTQSDQELGKADRAIRTLLQENRSPNFRTVSAFKAEVSKLMDDVTNAIKSKGGAVSTKTVEKELDKVVERFKYQVNNQSDLESIQSVLDNFRKNVLVAGKSGIPIETAQKMKQGTYANLSGKYGRIGESGVESEKGLARGLRVGIEELAPEVAPINARASDLMNAVNVAQRAAVRNASYNPGGLAWLANSPEMAAAFYLDRSPTFRAFLARQLYNKGSGAGVLAGGLGGGVLGAQSGNPDVSPTDILGILQGAR